MDLSLGVPSGGSGDERDNQSSPRRKRSYHRHTTEQTFRLEELFSKCPHPDENQRRQIALELALEPKQVKFWFQNKRTQKKTQNERADNTALRLENERIQSENIVMRETLKSILCSSCGGPQPCGDIEEHEHSVQQLKLENAQLKDEFEKVSKLLARYMEKPRSQAELPLDLAVGSSHDPTLASALNLAVENACQNLGLASSSDANILPKQISRRAEMEKAVMLQVATAAREELVRLLCTNEPLWVKSPADHRRLILHPESYEKLFPRANHFKSSIVREESSKDSRIVRINPTKLIDMFLDSNKWTNLFSTIISKAHTIKVLESGSPENPSGALLLMYEEMHILSPLVPSREFYFLRYCEQVEARVWVIVDVSFDYLKEDTPLFRSWRLPSGCMIHAMPNGSSQVTWVEHVQVDDKIQTHWLYKDVVTTSIAYGAERWLIELQRMCERFASAAANHIPSYDTGGVITVPEGRRSVMNLSHRMVKSFCEILNMSSKLDFPQNLAEENSSGVRISVRKNIEPGQPNGMIVVAATSFWLPIPSQNLFHFFRDAKRRVKWDVLSCGNPVHEIAHISNGTHPGNYISIIKPVNPNGVLIIQESFVDPLGSYVVYAPVKVTDLNIAISGGDSSMVSALPSGITISEDGRSVANAKASSSRNVGRTRGSLLTVAFQIVMSSPAAVNLDSVAAVNALITSTVQNIKDALNFCDLE